MKSLKIIQILVKIARIVCIVLFILCIVGAAGCLLALTIIPAIQWIPVDEGKTVADALAENGVNLPVVYAALSVGVIGCGASIFLAKWNQLFFEEELKVGTPFDFGVVKSMRKTALINIIVSVAAVATSAMVVGIIKAATHTQFDMQYGVFSVVGFGLFLLVISLFSEYGAEIAQGKEKPAEHVVEVEPEPEAKPEQE